MPEEQEGDEHRRRLVERFSGVVERERDAPQIGREDSRRDQDGHVQLARFKGVVRAGNENRSRPKYYRRRKEKEEQFFWNGRRKRNVEQHLTHRRVEDNGNSEPERDKEPPMGEML